MKATVDADLSTGRRLHEGTCPDVFARGAEDTPRCSWTIARPGQTESLRPPRSPSEGAISISDD